MAPRKDRVKPSQYPALPFHILRTAQVVSSIIVGSIMSYFLYQLRQDGYRLPWTFILLLSVSLLTLLTLTLTIILHLLFGLNPILNLSLNAVLATLWTLSFTLLSWWSSGTLSHVCNRQNWDTPTGISICRIYKALFSFALFGTVSTIAALVLDVYVWRSVGRRGVFSSLKMGDGKVLGGGAGAGIHMGGEANPNPVAGRAQKSRPRGGDGYAVPEEQFVYDEGDEADIGYHGAANEPGRAGH
ncbi:hypothetical protein P154DRAFT_549564 [Amniculicola lignicola CBS 123094]|uniref:MARVEL domain-containing protein n=1 Tax=Amniculicola lignicola CBS 123094 TaxID=1392246 RepID=A0A6A5VXK0_9PLEO|nr:hypothetical protein P154DRAFT_549564 [Amniculicola lignicola CBS 123094]